MLSGIHDGRFQIVWLDIEIYKWNENIETNRNFIRGLVNELKSSEIRFGIYTSIRSWTAIVGDWTELSNEMLWYSQWNGAASFEGFKPFGGWTKPSVKQYSGNQRLCNIDVDFDFS